MVVCGTSSAVPPTTKSNTVFVLVDYCGFADVEFRNPNVKTPNSDKLAHTGLILNCHYVFKYCSSSRVSLLSGRWSHHAHQLNPSSTVGANLNMTMLPAKLKQAGYLKDVSLMTQMYATICMSMEDTDSRGKT